MDQHNHSATPSDLSPPTPFRKQRFPAEKDFREFNHDSDRLWALGATYGSGPFNVVAVLDSVMYSQKTDRPKDSLSFSLEADYNFGAAKVYAAGMVFRDVKGQDFQGHGAKALNSLNTDIAYNGYSLELGADIPLMGGTAKVNAGWMSADNAETSADDTTRIAFAAGYVYPLSKRTQLYSAAGWVRDKSNNAEDSHPTAAEAIFGLLHRF